MKKEHPLTKKRKQATTGSSQAARTNRKFVFHLADGPDDYHAAIKSRPAKFSNTCERLVASAMRNGGLILTRDQSDDQVVGGTIFDFSTYEHALFVPLTWVSDDETEKTQALIFRSQLELVIKALIVSGRERLLAWRDESADDKRTIKDFNKLPRSNRMPVKMEVQGTVRDLFGDGRTVSITSLFIQPSDRPDLMNNVISMSKTIVDSAIRSARGRADGFCSGCKENDKKDKDKEKEKEKEIGSDFLPFIKTSVEKGGPDLVGLFDMYSRLEIYRFNRYNKPSHFVPLV